MRIVRDGWPSESNADERVVAVSYICWYLTCSSERITGHSYEAGPDRLPESRTAPVRVADNPPEAHMCNFAQWVFFVLVTPIALRGATGRIYCPATSGSRAALGPKSEIATAGQDGPAGDRGRRERCLPELVDSRLRRGRLAGRNPLSRSTVNRISSSPI